MIEYELPFEIYEKCPTCNGYGHVYLNGFTDRYLKQWKKDLMSPFEINGFGYNDCYRCDMTGYIYVGKLEELELEINDAN